MTSPARRARDDMSTTHPATRVIPHWFLTGPASADVLRGSVAPADGFRAHAKTMGTDITACGLPTTSWAKVLSLSFEASSSVARCPRCVSHVYGLRSTTEVSVPAMYHRSEG
jgi:hypothetical protein